MDVKSLRYGGDLFADVSERFEREPGPAAARIIVIARRLDIGPLIPEVKPGMRGAVEFGTAHRAREDGPIAGKTGTCSENHTHLGWFGSFNDIGSRKLVVVVLLTGGRPAIGPLAAGIAGETRGSPHSSTACRKHRAS